MGQSQSSSLPSAQLAFPTLVLAWLLYRFLSLGSRSKGLPPGPKTIPLLGNAHLIPTVPQDKHIYYDKLAREHNSELIALKIFNKVGIAMSALRRCGDLGLPLAPLVPRQ